MSARKSKRVGQQQEAQEAPAWLMQFLQHQEDQRLKQAEQQQKLDEERHRREIEERQRQFEATLQAITNPPSTSGSAHNNADSTRARSSEIKTPAPTRPTLLDVDTTYSKFRAWRLSWNDYVMLQKIDKLPVNVQKADLRCCFTEAMRFHIKCAMDITDDGNETVDEILNKIQDYLRQKRNVALDRVAFEERKQHRVRVSTNFMSLSESWQ